ncbi:hypothetical protein HPB50_023034 [Hyalomma asiaticum]|uniref:Uncharacterized protein n=1 Tax=Hyalomma asiaticum TaxID=266040 RepID=A0ACB7SMI0_HYAAI|nr:hypothetical protein HPB50_023034 [Hyalomma asiaticum]
MTESIGSAGASQPDEAGVGHTADAASTDVDVMVRPTGASSRPRSVPSEGRAGHDVAVGAVADRSHGKNFGRSSKTPLATPDHDCSQRGIHSYGSRSEPSATIFHTADANRGTSECGDKAAVVASNPVNNSPQHVQARSHSLSAQSLPRGDSNADTTHSSLSTSTVDASRNDQLGKDSRRASIPGKGTRKSSRSPVFSSREKNSSFEQRDALTSRNRNNVLRTIASESRCECPARKNSSTPNLRLNQSSFPASHLCTETGKRRPKQVLSAEECRKERGMLERDSTSRKRKLSSQAVSVDLRETTVASLALETPRNRPTRDDAASKPKRILSVILDTEDNKKATALFDDADKICVAENPPDKISEVKLEPATSVSVVSMSSTSLAPFVESDKSSAVSEKYQPFYVDAPKSETCASIGGTAKSGESLKNCILSTDSFPIAMEDSASDLSFSTSLAQSESLPVDFDTESQSASTQPGTSLSRQMRNEAADNLYYGPSSDSAQLSPQPELSFLLSDVLSGSGANVSWSALDGLFRENGALSNLWGGPSTSTNDAAIVASAAEPAKGASVPDRPTSPEKDDARTPSPHGRAKKTVSCPLSFDAESVCYETGDQAAFTPRQSSSNCWCCDKDERVLKHKQSSDHMPADEYLRLRERLDQRPHTPALWEDSKSGRSSLERDLDMATLDCSVAGFEQYSHVELFCHVSASSAKPRAIDSLEEWLKEDVAEGYEKYADEYHGTSKTVSSMQDINAVFSESGHNEIMVGDASGRQPITGEATREEIDTSYQKAGNASDAKPGFIPTVVHSGEPEVINAAEEYHSPKEAMKGKLEPRKTETAADAEQNAATSANGDPTLIPNIHLPDVLPVSYVNTRYTGIELAQALDEFATGLSLKDVVFIPCRTTGVTPMPRLDDVDFSKFVVDDAMSVRESLAKMPKIICKGTLTK